MAEQCEVLGAGGGRTGHTSTTPESCEPARRLRLLHYEIMERKDV
jgi:hypothetical protein